MLVQAQTIPNPLVITDLERDIDYMAQDIYRAWVQKSGHPLDCTVRNLRALKRHAKKAAEVYFELPKLKKVKPTIVPLTTVTLRAITDRINSFGGDYNERYIADHLNRYSEGEPKQWTSLMLLNEHEYGHLVSYFRLPD